MNDRAEPTTIADRNRRRFDRWAGTYERGPVSRFLIGLQREALDALNLQPSDDVLDVACGTGAAVRMAASVARRAVGVDLSPAMIERARTYAAGLQNVEFRVADSEGLPFGDGEMTAVMTTTAFHHFTDPEMALREMARVLASGGRMVIGDASSDRPAARIADVFLRRFEPGHVRLYRLSELSGFIHGAGLRHAEARPQYGGGYSIVRAIKP